MVFNASDSIRELVKAELNVVIRIDFDYSDGGHGRLRLLVASRFRFFGAHRGDR